MIAGIHPRQNDVIPLVTASYAVVGRLFNVVLLCLKIMSRVVQLGILHMLFSCCTFGFVDLTLTVLGLC